MESILPFIGVAVFALCPLMMIGIPVGGWLIARARGQKASLGMGCHGGHGEHHAPAAGGTVDPH